MNRCCSAHCIGLLLTSLLFGLVGCGQPVGPTSGRVTFSDGAPVRSGSIEFRSTVDRQRYASRIETDGSFHPTSQDGEVGLPPGTYDVVVVQIVLTEDLAKKAHTHGGTVPRRYADYYTSGLTVEVSEQTETVDIQVDAEGAN
ncbi:carboxypeptidase-like regulatory domain-containing protein [Roseiconus lacunae]|uniref:Carboxypeptidase regulatory-like domain-containing protein n=1 Tax=Roseiconus lacunae TaxID=2605694 RepID=A0ABT7PSN0_9BACT|nr:carboxypeptidase-like regulatory domain-containing protein [Roseiconus lacunae]MDM4019358.1 carboxypeptidase regulatory-like domain-containing protein [Roseiconus lacunae]